MLGWFLIERLKSGHATTLGAASGAVAGLVAITPCAGFVGGPAPLIIGAAAGVLCFPALGIREKMDWDDSLDVINGEFDGLLYGGGLELLKDQFVAAIAVGAFSFVVTYALARGIDSTMRLRIDETSELQDLDQSQHPESAYTS
jgi:Amt family ammonium transporter